MRYFICANEDKRSMELVDKIRNGLKGCYDFIYDENNPEVVISIGGDGRFLKTVQKYLIDNKTISFIGISTGSLGYLCDYKDSEIDVFLKDFVSNKPRYESKNLIEVYNSQGVNFYLNEFRIERFFNTFKCDVYINDCYFESFSGNGLNISSSTGSTGLNKSLGGPVISSNVNCLVMGEIAPINNSISQTLNSFLVLGSQDVITLRGDFLDCSLGGDNYNEIINSSINFVTIRISKIKIKLVHFTKKDFYSNVRKCFIERK